MKNKSLVKSCLVNIEQIQTHQKNLLAALNRARELNQGARDGCHAGNLFENLMRAELDQWRNLFMFALTLPEKETKDIKALAHARFLNDRTMVAHYFNDGVTPGMWLSKTEDEFRKLCREYFGGTPRKKA